MKSKVVLVAILFCCLGAFFIQISLSHQVIVAKPTEETVRQVNQTEIEPAPEKAEKATSEKPMAKKTVNDYAPNNLIPLAVGNKWVYAWSSAFISEGESTESSKSLYHCWMSYGYKGLGVMASAYHYNAL